MRLSALVLALALPGALHAAPADLEAQVRAALNRPELQGTRWGLRVEDKAGNVLLSIAPDDRFQPASNTKVFVTSAVLDALSLIHI